MNRVSDIRNRFVEVRNDPSHRVGDTIELIGESFEADEPTIFLKPNEDYIQREIRWYESQSRFVQDIEGKTPKIWESVSSRHGMINSNYGYLLFSDENLNQYGHVLRELKQSHDSRRAVAVYTRPSIHVDAYSDGMVDFICTNTVTYEMRQGHDDPDDVWTLHAVVNMRSNDAVYGYRNDYAWQLHVLNMLVDDINSDNDDGISVRAGSIYWQTASIHIYRRHWHLLGDDVVEDL